MINKKSQRALSIYLHIPFCVRKCLYCDFLSVQLKKQPAADYMEALKKEIKLRAETFSGDQVETVFIGGGTPTAIDAAHIEEMMEQLFSQFHFNEAAEITIEANPGTVTKENLVRYRKAGIGRISIGAQSLLEHELTILGRIHTVEEFYDTFYHAREAGFDNINVDLMEALPGQQEKDLSHTLEKLVSCKPEHISAYSLIVEEETPFFEMMANRKLPPLPSEEEDRQMDKKTQELLSAFGYERYEISNYALQGRECRHNKVYWERGNYLGLGAGAASMVDNIRFRNTRDIKGYIDILKNGENPLAGLQRERQILSKKEQMEEFMFLGLRLTKGVSKETFKQTFACPIEEKYNLLLKKLERQGLIENREYVRLTPYGRDISNYVMSQFIF